MASSHSFYIPSPSMSSFSSLSATNSDYGGDITGKMPILPKEVIKYSQVPKGKEGNDFFTATTIPKGLLHKHSTKKGTWGVINVSKGTLEYVIQRGDDSNPIQDIFELKAPAEGIIEPQILHHVKAKTDDVEFVVEFHRFPNTGPVNEQREGL